MGDFLMKTKIEDRKDVYETIEKIAKEELFMDTLEQRHRDSLDFYDVSVWGAKKALLKAFRAGIEFQLKKQEKFEKEWEKKTKEGKK